MNWHLPDTLAVNKDRIFSSSGAFTGCGSSKQHLGSNWIIQKRKKELDTDDERFTECTVARIVASNYTSEFFFSWRVRYIPIT